MKKYSSKQVTKKRRMRNFATRLEHRNIGGKHNVAKGRKKK
jgi:hypothetical protein